MLVTKNIISNFVGQIYTALLGLVFLPYYLSKLGPEGFSLIGIYSLLQAWLHLLDGGLTATLGRESAKYLGGGHSKVSIRSLIRSTEYISLVITGIIILVIFTFSSLISNQWLNPEELSPNIISKCLFLFSFIISLRFIEGLYKSILNGLQKQFALNILVSINATIRWAGAALILHLGYINPTSFFTWQLIASIIAAMTYSSLSYKYLPKISKKFIGFSFKSLSVIKKFALGMILINIFALLVGQIDKIILSKVISLEAFGYYTLASSIAGFTFFLSSAITNAHYPLLCKFKQENNKNNFAKTLHSSSRLTTIVIGSASIYIIFFCQELLGFWIQSSNTISEIVLIVKLLIVGNFLNTLMWIPYHAQLAYGWTSITIKTNAALCIVVPPLIYFFSNSYGAEGAALIWIFVNCIYISISQFVVFPRILPSEKTKWIYQDTLRPLIIIILITSFLRIIYPSYASIFIQNLYLFISPLFLLFLTLKLFRIKNLEINLNP